MRRLKGNISFCVMLVECSAGHYGNDCNSICGNCKDKDVCDGGDGHCPNGCKENWQGPKCDGEESIF